MPEALVNVLLVGFGGAVGAIARYGLTGAAQRAIGGELGARYPLGTLAANVLGCLMAGVVAYFFVDRPVLTPHQRLLLMTGFLGGLTTFSSFGYETAMMARGSDWWAAFLNIAANVVLSLAAVWAGWAGSRAVWG